MTHRPNGEESTVTANTDSTRTLLLDGRLLDPPEGIRPVLRRVPSESRFEGTPITPAKPEHK